MREWFGRMERKRKRGKKERQVKVWFECLVRLLFFLLWGRIDFWFLVRTSANVGRAQR